jgi:hypothetical protein
MTMCSWCKGRCGDVYCSIVTRVSASKPASRPARGADWLHALILPHVHDTQQLDRRCHTLV